MCKRRISAVLAVLLLACVSGNEVCAKEMTGGSDKNHSPVLTVWLDQENEYLLRQMISIYEYNVKAAKGGIYEEYYPEVIWELVDKSYLTPVQYRRELMDALDAGEGPDLIYMDGFNEINPVDMISAGYLLPMEDPLNDRGRELKYIPGTLEAGAAEGRQYVLPVSIECPVLFGERTALEEAGIRTDGSYGSLEELLEDLAAAGKKTGKHILENAEAADWIETYCMLEEKAAGTKSRAMQKEEKRQRGKLENEEDREGAAEADRERILELLEDVREQSGTEEGWFASYEGIRGGTCLLAGCGVKNYRQMSMNLGLLSEEELVFLSVPFEDGVVRSVIQESFGINANTAHPELEGTMRLLFQTIFITLADDYPALDEYWKSLLQKTFWLSSEQFGREKYTHSKGISNEVSKAVLACSRDAAAGAVYAQQAVKSEEEEVITVLYEDGGMNGSWNISDWLEKSAAKWEQEHPGFHIQIMTAPTSANAVNAYYGYMEAAGIAPDILLGSSYGLVAATWMNEDHHYADLEPLLQKYQEKLDFLPRWAAEGVLWNGTVAGLPCCISLRPGLWYSRKLAAAAGFPEDWRPQDLEELTEGLEKLKQASGNKGPCILSGSSVLKALSYMAVTDPEELVQEEDGKWKVSREGWISFLARMQEWVRQGLVSFITPAAGEMTEEQAAVALAEGRLPAVISDWGFGSWYDGDTEDLAFVSLGTVVDVNVFTISEKAEYQEEVFEFCLTALQNAEYEKTMEDICKLPVTTAGDSIRFVLPNQTPACDFVDLMGALQDFGDMTAEEMAEKYRMYEWLE